MNEYLNTLYDLENEAQILNLEIAKEINKRSK